LTITNGRPVPGSHGGGIRNDGNLTVTNARIIDNHVTSAIGDSHGGGIFNSSSGTLLLTFSSVLGNTATSTTAFQAFVRGGGIANFGVSVTLRNSLVAGNTVTIAGTLKAFAYGGGVFSGSLGEPQVIVENCTIQGNTAHADGTDDRVALSRGGGLFIGGGSTAEIRNSTIVDNIATGDNPVSGGLETNPLGNSLVTNTILSLNTPNNVVGGIGSLGYNLIDRDPLLGPLQDNGGSTFTMALLPGSPAIDSGDNTGAPEWDQRGPGFPRVVYGTVDIGAFEVQATGTPPSRTFFLDPLSALALREGWLD
jgi:hypothetical protein